MKYLLALGFLGMARAHVCGYYDIIGLRCDTWTSGDGRYTVSDCSPSDIPNGWKATDDDPSTYYLEHQDLTGDSRIKSSICRRSDGNFCLEGFTPSDGVCTAPNEAGSGSGLDGYTVIESQTSMACETEETCFSTLVNYADAYTNKLNGDNCGTDDSSLYTSNACVQECAERCFGHNTDLDSLGVLIVPPSNFGYGDASRPDCWCTSQLINDAGASTSLGQGTTQIDVARESGETAPATAPTTTEAPTEAPETTEAPTTTAAPATTAAPETTDTTNPCLAITNAEEYINTQCCKC